MLVIRTSVDHGTALSLAGSGRADSGSLKAALQTAVELAQQQTNPKPPTAPALPALKQPETHSLGFQAETFAKP